MLLFQPTNYDHQKNFFDTSSVEQVIKTIIRYQSRCCYWLSKVNSLPVEFYTAQMRKEFDTENLIFSPRVLT